MGKIKEMVNRFIFKPRTKFKKMMWAILILIILPSIIQIYVIPAFLEWRSPDPLIVGTVVEMGLANLDLYPERSSDLFSDVRSLEISITERYAELVFTKHKDYKTYDEQGYYPNALTGSEAFLHFYHCPDCVAYIGRLNNSGNAKATKIDLKIYTGPVKANLTSASSEYESVSGRCGGIFNEKSCVASYENIDVAEEVNFAVTADEPFQITDIDCVVDDKYPCEIIFVKVYLQSFNPNATELLIDNKTLVLPTREVFNETKYYALDPQSSLDGCAFVDCWKDITSTLEIYDERKFVK